MKTMGLLTAILFLAARAFPATALHHYAFDGPGVVDSLGTANGTLENGAVILSGRLTLDGIDDHVQFGEQIIPIPGSFSVAFSAQEISRQPGFANVITQGRTQGPGFFFGYEHGHNIRISDDLPNTGLPFADDGLCHHYAVTVGSDTRIYIDGSLAGTFLPIRIAVGGDNTRLGRQYESYGEFFSGTIDDLWVFSGALTAHEVAALARGEDSLTNQPPYVASELLQAGAWRPSAEAFVHVVTVLGTRATVTSRTSEVVLLDMNSPAHPVTLGTWTSPMPISDTVSDANLTYVASWEMDFLSTIEVVDFTDPAKPVLRSYYDTPGYAHELLLRGHLLYVADGEGGLLVLDVRDPANPRRLGGFDTKGSVQHVEVSGTYAYIPDGNWLVILDVSDPASPRRVGLYEVAEGISSLKAYGTRLYLSDASGGVRVLDVSKPANIQLLLEYRGWGRGTQAMAVSGRYLYLAKGSSGLEVLDLNDLATPVGVTGAWSSSAEDVALMGQYALVAGGDKGFVVYEVQQSLYPPLKQPVISGGNLTVTWATTNDVRLQKTANLVNPVWQDVSASEGTNTVTLPMTEPMSYFRLVKGPKPGQLLPGMVAWWPGDGDASDLIGTNHGTLMNGATFAEGEVGQAFSCDGLDDFLETPSSDALELTNAISVEGWIYMEAEPAYTGTIIMKGVHENSGALDWDLAVSDAFRLRPHVQVNEGWVYFDCQTRLETQTWYHVAMTYDGQRLLGYVNGVLDGEGPCSGPLRSSTYSVRIGCVAPSYASGFDGLIDEVSIYNRALTPNEIKAIYDAGSAGKAKPSR